MLTLHEFGLYKNLNEWSHGHYRKKKKTFHAAREIKIDKQKVDLSIQIKASGAGQMKKLRLKDATTKVR